MGVTTISANINDEGSLEEMCGRCSVLLDVVGPYVLYGEAVVKACINKGTDYVDITGETYVRINLIINIYIYIYIYIFFFLLNHNS